ncbi:MAG: hypothetical protein AAF614_00020 [Chloroflexota bacterium]
MASEERLPHKVREPIEAMAAFWKSSKWILLLLGVFLSACVLAPPQQPAATATPSTTQTLYDNQTIRLIVPFAPGGGTDTWARTVAPQLQKHLGRNVRVQTINRPGASGVAGTNAFFYNHDPQTILVSSGSIFFPYLLGDSSVEYDFNQFVPILGSPVGGIVFVSPTTGITSVDDLCSTEQRLTYGGISASGLDIVPLITFELLGLDVQTFFGYDGKGASRVAFEQGETTIEFQTTPGYLANGERLMEANLTVPLFTFGLLNNQGQVVRDPAFPDLPTVQEVYTICFGTEPSGVAWDVYKGTLAAGFTIQKVMWVHGDTPEEAITALRQAAETAVSDPEFRESAQNLIGNYDFFIGHEAQLTFAAASSLSPESITWLKTLLAEKYSASPAEE